jgi:hypothetical protein
VLQAFKSWPKPYCDMVNSVINILYDEMKVPGLSNYRRTLESAPLLGLKPSTASALTDSSVIGDFAMYATMKRGVPLFADLSDNTSIFVKDILTQSFPPSNIPAITRELKIQFLYSFLETDISFGPSDESIYAFEKLPEADLNTLFAQIQEIISNSKKMGADACKV